MLNFSKINVLIIYIIFLFISFFSILNFQENKIIDKKVNLGLDLQGGSYLLLEINSDNLVEEKIQSKVIPIKKLLKDNGLSYQNFKINNQNLNLIIDDVEKFELIFFSKKDNCSLNIIDNEETEDFYKNANDIVQFWWKKEAVPIILEKKSILARLFNFLFD